MATIPSGKAIDAAYLLTQLKAFDSQVLQAKYNEKFQVTTMPTASAELVGNTVLQYIGATDANFMNGYFYRCVEKSGEAGTVYEWEQVDQSAPEYSIKKLDTATEGYAATYSLTKDGAEVGTKIDIPKDYFVTDASIGTVSAEDKAAGGKFENNTGFNVGDAYIELQVSLKDQTEPKYLYVNVSALVDTYTEGSGIAIADNAIAVKLAATDSGLTFKDNGLAIEFETTDINFETDWVTE